MNAPFVFMFDVQNCPKFPKCNCSLDYGLQLWSFMSMSKQFSLAVLLIRFIASTHLKFTLQATFNHDFDNLMTSGDNHIKTKNISQKKIFKKIN